MTSQPTPGFSLFDGDTLPQIQSSLPPEAFRLFPESLDGKLAAYFRVPAYQGRAANVFARIAGPASEPAL